MLITGARLEKDKSGKGSKIPVTHDVFTAVKEGNLAVLNRMIDEGLNVNKCRWSGFSLLHRACSEGQTDVCQVLIEAGAKVNERSVWGWYTPLHIALANGWQHTAAWLITQGADCHIKSKSGDDCCDYAARRGFKELASDFRVKMMKLDMMQRVKERNARLQAIAEANKRESEEVAATAAHMPATKAAAAAGEEKDAS